MRDLFIRGKNNECLNSKEIEKITRDIFHKIQTEQGSSESTYDRLVSLYSHEYFCVDKQFFEDKICLDVGCGNNAHASKALLELGIKKIYALDLDETIFDTVPKFLSGFEDKFELKVGNVLNLPYDDNFFDFVHCSGVLHHTVDLFKGLSELARVTKHGGMIYIGIFGAGTGIFSQITELFRNEYKQNSEFRILIDTLDREGVLQCINYIYNELDNHNDPIIEKIPKGVLESLINDDLILTIKDRITAPIYENTPIKKIETWFENNEFTNFERLKRYPKIDNIRGLLSPLYHNHDSKFSKILLGEGFIQVKAIKK